MVEELEVTARPPGPALWRVRKGEAEVTILGGWSPLPHRLEWRSPRLDRALGEARVVLLPPRQRMSVLDGAGLVLKYAALRAKHGDMTASLPPALRERLERASAAYGLKMDRYQGWKPGVAAFRLLGDYREKAGLSSAKPASTVERRAKAGGVKTRAVDDYSPADLLRSAARLPDAVHVACLEAALDEVDQEAARAKAAADAWAAGDLAGLRAQGPPPLLDRCLMQVGGYRNLLERGTAKAVADIEGALDQGGKTVAVIDLRYLLRGDGVLDRLKARGAVIDLPPDS